MLDFDNLGEVPHEAIVKYKVVSKSVTKVYMSAHVAYIRQGAWLDFVNIAVG